MQSTSKNEMEQSHNVYFSKLKSTVHMNFCYIYCLPLSQTIQRSLTRIQVPFEGFTTYFSFYLFLLPAHPLALQSQTSWSPDFSAHLEFRQCCSLHVQTPLVTSVLETSSQPSLWIPANLSDISLSSNCLLWLPVSETRLQVPAEQPPCAIWYSTGYTGGSLIPSGAQ